jgi:NADH:ubiquinone oxidoreductase subunit 4 (subunit M)
MVLVPMVLLIIFLGVYPQPVINAVRKAVNTISHVSAEGKPISDQPGKGGSDE